MSKMWPKSTMRIPAVVVPKSPLWLIMKPKVIQVRAMHLEKITLLNEICCKISFVELVPDYYLFQNIFDFILQV